MRHAVEMEIEIILLLFDILPSFLTLLCSFTISTCHWAQHACFDSLVNDTWGLILVFRITCIFEIQGAIEENGETCFGVIPWTELFSVPGGSHLVLSAGPWWSALLVLSNHSLVFLVLLIAVYIVLWLGKMKHCVYLLSSKRGHGREEETPTSLRTHPGQALVLGRETVDCDNQGQGVANPEVLKISRFLNGLVHLSLFQAQLLMIM